MTEFLLPDIGDGLTEAEVVRWLVSEGAQVGRDEPLVEVETDKAVVVLPSPVAGTVVKCGAQPGDTIAVGSVVAVIGLPSDEAGSAQARPVAPPAEERPDQEEPVDPGGPQEGGIKALPVVRRLARQKGVDLAEVIGSGPDGRITREDVLASADGPPVASGPVASPLETTSRPLTKLQRTIASNMTRSWAEIPHVTTFDQLDATRILAVRQALAERHDTAVRLDALVIGAVIPALRRFPEFNATLDGEELLLHPACHIGVAINASQGLLVGVVRNAGDQTIMQLAETTARVAEQGKARTLGVSELTGQTFTVSNIGALGGGYGTPIIPHENTAILAVGKVVDTPVAEDGEVVVRPVMPLSLSFDHRVIDGALSRRFMDMVIENLSEPALFLA